MANLPISKCAGSTELGLLYQLHLLFDECIGSDLVNAIEFELY